GDLHIREGPQLIHNDIAVVLNTQAQVFDHVLGAGQGGFGGGLRHGGRIRRDLTLDVTHHFDQAAVAHSPPDPEAGHPIQLRYAVQHDQVRRLDVFVGEIERRRSLFAVEHQLVIDVVQDQVNIAILAEIDDLSDEVG